MKNIKTTSMFRVKQSFFYGWIIIFISAMGMFFSGPGQTYSISIFINSYIDQFQWSRSFVSSIYSVATLGAGLILPVVGGYIDKIGHRKMIVLIAFLLGVTCLWMSFIQNSIMLLIGFLFLRLLGQGSMTLIPSTLIPQWFEKSRGMAMSLMALGGVAASAIIPLVNNYFIENKGVSYTWRIWSFLLIGLMVPLGWSLIRNKPEEMGLSPDGVFVDSLQGTKREKPIVQIIEDSSWTLKEARAQRTFWFMIFCAVVPSMINTGLVFHMVSIMEGKGFDSTFAATILGMTAMVQFPFTFVAGYIVDRVEVHLVKAVNFGLLIIAMIAIAYIRSAELMIIYSFLHGIFMAFDSVSTGVLWPNYYGRKYLGKIRGVAMMAVVIGSSLGALPFGIAYDVFHDYKQIILGMLIIPVLASVAAYVSPSPKKDK